MANMVAPTGFSLFRFLPPELQLQIWEETILGEYHNRIVPLARDTKRIILMTAALRRPSALFAACRQSRSVATRLYDQALPVVPFFPDGTNYALPGQLVALGAEADQQPRGVVRVSFRLDLFLVSPVTATFQRNKTSPWEWQSLADAPPRFLVVRDPRLPPRYMTTALPPPMRAAIQRIVEHHDRLPGYPRAADPSQVAHSFRRAEFPSVRVCYHFDNFGNKLARRLLWHLGQEAYTSDQLLEWLQPFVCPNPQGT